MSKELEILENIECNCELYAFKYEDFKSIRKALENYDYLKNFFDKLKEKYGIDDLDYLEHIVWEHHNVIQVIKNTIAFNEGLPEIIPNSEKFDFMYRIQLSVQRVLENKERELLREWILKECFPKELRAFEIIENKNVNTCLLKDSDSVDEYNQICRYATKYSNRNSYPELLAQEEFDSLKEVLK